MRRWDDNIKVDLRGIGLDSVDFIILAQYKDKWLTFMNTVMNFRIL